MSYKRPQTTQRGVPATWDDAKQTETAVCPWCHCSVNGQYTDAGWLKSDSFCLHFMGWVSTGGTGAGAQFHGPASELHE